MGAGDRDEGWEAQSERAQRLEERGETQEAQALPGAESEGSSET